MLTSACRYGVLAMIHLARNVDAGFIPVRQIGNDLDVSNPFLSKIMQQLVAHDLVVSLRGPTGGVKLSKSASSIVLNDIVEAIDGRKNARKLRTGPPRLWQQCAVSASRNLDVRAHGLLSNA